MSEQSTTKSPIGTPPPARLTVKVGDGEQEVFMSFGLLNELTPLVGGPEKVAEFDFDALLRETSIRLCLAPRNERRKIPEEYILPELDLEQSEILVDWVKDHVLSFFIRRLMKNIEIFDTNAEALKLSARLKVNPTG